jgi:leucyl aminopeptidase
MRVELSSGDAESVEADVLAVPLADPSPPLPAGASRLDQLLDGRLARVAEQETVAAKAGQTAVLHLAGEVPAGRVAAVGLGPGAALDPDAVRTAAAGVVRATSRVGGTIAWLVDDGLTLPSPEQARAAVDGLMLGGYDPGRWKADGDRPKHFERLVLVGADEGALAAAERAARVATAANRARDLANAPANELTPEALAARAEEVAGVSEHLSAEALGPDEIRALGMGSFLAVAQGSHNEPRLIVLRYEPPQPQANVVLGLVGKGITFDTGGISIKPAAYMEDMKGDMAGAAAVVEGIGAVAELGLPLRALAVVAATENMPGGGAYRPGDILRAMNGKTIEVINTDAEGRLVLADALTYAREQGATHIVDFATLTGVMEAALGDFYAGVFGNDAAWRDQIVEAGETSGDHAWPLPLHDRFRRYIDSTFADMKNSSILRQGVPVLAAEFLQEFAGEGPWAHIDMAGTGYFRWPRPDYLWQKGGTGYGVRLITELAGRLSS